MTSRRRRNARLVGKWMVYLLVLLVSATLQTVPGLLTIGQGRPIFILPLCIAVAVYEGEFSGALFGAVGGLLWDFTAMRVPGLLALGLLILCFFVAILVQMYLRVTVTNFILLCGAAAFLVTGVDFLFYYLMPGYGGAELRYWSVVLPTVVLTALLSPLSMYTVRGIFRRITVEE